MKIKNALLLTAIIATPFLLGCNSATYTATIKGDHITETSFNFTDSNHATHTTELEIESGYKTVSYSLSDEDSAIVTLSETTLTVTPIKNQDIVIMITTERREKGTYQITLDAGIGKITGTDQQKCTVTVESGIWLYTALKSYTATYDDDHRFDDWLLVEGDTSTNIKDNFCIADKDYTLYASYSGEFPVTWIIDEGVPPDPEEIVNYSYGEIPSHDNPGCKDVEGDEANCFVGWDKEIKPVVGPVTYTATYETQSINTTITLSDIEQEREVSFNECYPYGKNIIQIDWGDGTINSEISHKYDQAITESFNIVITSAEITYINIPNSISTKVTEISYSHAIKTIETEAIPNHSDESVLNKIVIPSSVNEIKEGAFASITSLETVEIESDSLLTWIGSEAFEGTGLTAIQLPKTLNSIGSAAFKNAKNISEITIPNNITNISDETFQGCENLVNVIFDEGSQIRTIGSEAFASTKIKRIKLPNTVEEIGDWAFENCGQLEVFDMTSYGTPTATPSLGNFAFSNTSSRLRIYVRDELVKQILSISSGWVEYKDYITADPVPPEPSAIL